PSVSTNSDSSSPSMNSSTRIVSPASPKARPSSIERAASRAASVVSQTITPLPAASPDALITTGAPSSSIARSASASDEARSARAVGTAADSITDLANALDDSSRAAARDGPKIGMRAPRKASAIPASSAASGPTSVQSTAVSRASATSAPTWWPPRECTVPARRFPDCPAPRKSRPRDHPAAGARRARVRARRSPRREPSSIAPGRADGIRRARQTVLELVDGLAGLVAVIPGGIDVVFLERLIGVALAAAEIVAGENLVEASRPLPAQQLGGAHGVHGMRAHHGIQDLQHRVPRVAARLVLLGLADEFFDAERVAVRLAAGQFHLGAHRRVEILRDEESGAVRRELALARPLEERELEGEERG